MIKWGEVEGSFQSLCKTPLTYRWLIWFRSMLSSAFPSTHVARSCPTLGRNYEHLRSYFLPQVGQEIRTSFRRFRQRPCGCYSRTSWKSAFSLFKLAFILTKDISICKVRAIRFVPLDCVLIITWTFRDFPTVVAFDVKRTHPKLNPREGWALTLNGEKHNFFCARKWQAFTSWVVASSFTEDWRRYFLCTCINKHGVIWVRLRSCFRRGFYRSAGDRATHFCVNIPVKSSWNLHDRQINTR